MCACACVRCRQLQHCGQMHPPLALLCAWCLTQPKKPSQAHPKPAQTHLWHYHALHPVDKRVQVAPLKARPAALQHIHGSRHRRTAPVSRYVFNFDVPTRSLNTIGSTRGSWPASFMRSSHTICAFLNSPCSLQRSVAIAKPKHFVSARPRLHTVPWPKHQDTSAHANTHTHCLHDCKLTTQPPAVRCGR